MTAHAWPSRVASSREQAGRERTDSVRSPKMADGLCAEESSVVIETTAVISCSSNDICSSVESVNINSVNVGACESFYNKGGDSVELYDELCVKDPTEDNILDINMPSSPPTIITASDEDCRKKRCVDRYDSSESSDSGVAILSCTDCSGSSTASSDIADPGSPYSTASSHSEDSGPQPAKMPPTQTAHHPPWPWTEEDQLSLKRTTTNLLDKTAFNKRIKTTTTDITTPKCLNNNITSTTTRTAIIKNELTSLKKHLLEPKLQQGKITEYFKSQYKNTNIINKKELSNIIIKHNVNKFINLVESNKKIIRVPQNKTPLEKLTKRRLAAISVPRKILPAPSKTPPNTYHAAPIITTLIPNVAYLPTTTPKQADSSPNNSIFMSQFTISDKIISSRTPLISVVPTTINNFNCVKLNSAVVPIVKLNMPLNCALQTTTVPTTTPTLINNKPKLEISNMKQPKSPNNNIIISCTQTASTSIDINQCLAEELSPGDSGCLSSSNSLEVNVDVIVKIQEQRSPILSQPKTIRFPAKERIEPKNKLAVSSDTALCLWDECDAQFDTSGALLDHLQVNHVISQASQEQYVCLWQGCKVHGRKSCSRSWLERHVLAHAGSKPYRCIVDGCGQRFNSQLALERHVNGHFSTDNSQNGSTKKSVENGSVKLFRRNGKKIRFRRQPWSARMFDFIDSGIMEGLQYKLVSMTEKRTLGQFENVAAGDQVTLHSEVIAKRLEPDGTSQMLLRWHPRDIVDDEWIQEKKYSKTKTVSIPKLEAAAKTTLKSILFPPLDQLSPAPSASHQTTKQKHRRKPCKIT